MVSSQEGETAFDISAYAAHMSALLGAHIIKVKPPTAALENKDARKVYEEQGIPALLTVSAMLQSSFNGRRLVVFSGGASRIRPDCLMKSVPCVMVGPRVRSSAEYISAAAEEALALLSTIIDITVDGSNIRPPGFWSISR